MSFSPPPPLFFASFALEIIFSLGCCPPPSPLFSPQPRTAIVVRIYEALQASMESSITFGPSIFLASQQQRHSLRPAYSLFLFSWSCALHAHAHTHTHAYLAVARLTTDEAI